MNTKTKILNSLLELAANEGLGSVSMSQIAKKAGIQKSTLYSHFESKEKMIQLLYEYVRSESMQSNHLDQIDCGEFVKNKNVYTILRECVDGYMKMNSEKKMQQFYRLISSERVFHKEAAEIMAIETTRMINATKMLFYAMEIHEIVHFNNIDLDALSFAMTIHGLIDYEQDQQLSEISKEKKGCMIEKYLRDFAGQYETKGGNVE